MAHAMKPGTAGRLGKARAALARALALIERGAAERAADRAYAAMLHTARALLNESGVRLHAHRKILEACAQRYAAGGPFDSSLHRTLLEWRQKRELGDANDEVLLGDAERLTELAGAFLHRTEEHLGVDS